MRTKRQLAVADREVEVDLIWRPHPTVVHVVTEEVTVSAEDASLHVVGKGGDGVIAVNGGVVHSDAEALEDAAQDEIHVGNTVTSAGGEFLLSPREPFP